MAERLPRLVAAACALVLPAGLYATQVVDDGHPAEVRVGTAGPAYEVDRDTHDTATSVPDDEAPPTSSSEEDGRVTTTGRPTSSSSSTVAGNRAQESTSTTVAATSAPSLRGRIAFQRATPVVASIWSMRPDGTDLRLEVECAHPATFTGGFDVSPDGRFVVRTCGTSSSSPVAGELVIQSVDGALTRSVLTFTGMLDMGYPRWSPDGRTIAVLRPFGGEVDLIDASTGSLRRLTLDPPANGTLSWSPDGHHLVDGVLQTVDVDTGARSDLGAWLPEATRESLNSVTRGRWGLDGWIYFQEEQAEDGELTRLTLSRIQPTTHVLQRLLDLPSGLSISEPESTPDGRLLLQLGGELLLLVPGTGARISVPAPAGSYDFRTPRGPTGW